MSNNSKKPLIYQYLKKIFLYLRIRNYLMLDQKDKNYQAAKNKDYKLQEQSIMRKIYTY